MKAHPLAQRSHPAARAALLAALCLALLCAFTSLPALAVGRLADITVIDRNTGASLPVYNHHGQYWVAGTPGARYAVAVQSRHGQRLLAVPAVDGINVLSGQTAAWNQPGYVFTGYSNYQMTGWRKSNSEVAAFEFSSLGDSYAGLTGRPANVGVIGVALFKEKQVPVSRDDQEFSKNEGAWPSGRSKSIASPAPELAPAPVPAATSRNADRAGNETSDLASPGSAASANEGARRSAPQGTAKLGTAHGQRESSVVNQTAFERQQTQPDEVVLIRYDSRANLVALGVIRVAPTLQNPNAFPDSANAYVPDPLQRRY